jgi:NAD(P)-dependent dehydrogenase (short-subunit alcohol dehydrogenase family)
MLFDGKVALVVGGGRGVGRAAALRLASEGAAVAVVDSGVARDGRDADPPEDPAAEVAAEIVASGGRAIAIKEPIHLAGAADRVVASTVDTLGRLDVLVHAAGIVRDASFLKMDESAFREVLEVHALGALFATQAAARAMIKAGEGGRVVLCTGAAGLLGNLGQVNAAAAHAATYAVMRTAAIELQKHKITVNAVAPLAKTRLTEDLPMFQGTDTLGPEHAAAAIAFLASDRVGERTGFVLGSAGAQLYAYKLVQTSGRFKDEGAPWTVDEIAEHWDAIVK